MARERSRAYPAYSLQDAVAWAEVLQKNIGRGVFDRDMAARSFGAANARGMVPRKVASMVQFGILSLRKEGYRLSELGMRIVMPCNDSERSEAIAEAFTNPDLYRDILDRYMGELSIPAQLSNILVRDFRITPPAAPIVVRVFLESGRYAGVLDEDNCIIGDTGSPSISLNEADQVDIDTDIVDSGSQSVHTNVDRSMPTKAIATESATQVGQQVQELRLSKGSARLTVPEELSIRDIKLLQKMLEVWALQVELLQTDEETDA